MNMVLLLVLLTYCILSGLYYIKHVTDPFYKSKKMRSVIARDLGKHESEITRWDVIVWMSERYKITITGVKRK